MNFKCAAVIWSLALSGCLFSYGDNGEGCYPNHTCFDGLVCISPVAGYSWGICVKSGNLPDGGSR